MHHISRTERRVLLGYYTLHFSTCRCAVQQQCTIEISHPAVPTVTSKFLPKRGPPIIIKILPYCCLPNGQILPYVACTKRSIALPFSLPNRFTFINQTLHALYMHTTDARTLLLHVSALCVCCTFTSTHFTKRTRCHYLGTCSVLNMYFSKTVSLSFSSLRVLFFSLPSFLPFPIFAVVRCTSCPVHSSGAAHTYSLPFRTHI